MHAWNLSEPNKIEKMESAPEKVEQGFCKVRITYAGVTSNDFDIFRGKFSVNYPIVMGRNATGVISEIDESETLKKGDRVVISPYIPCFNCISCREGNPSECTDLSYAGVDVNGFLSDFVVVPISNVFILPDSVSDEDAVFIPYVSLALTVLDRIEFEHGTFIGIGSGGTLGNILAQLCIYYQAVPVVFDEVQSHLDTAKNVGVYYTFLNDENTTKKVMQVTSGKLLDCLIYVRQDSMQIIDSFKYLKNAGELVISPIATIDAGNVNVPLKHILDQEITVLPVPYRIDNMETAINLIVNHSINIEPLKSGQIRIDEIQNFFTGAYPEIEGKPFFMELVKI